MRRIKVPTGDILVIDGEHGPLECLSLGDYGRAVNVKATFLGLTDEINCVPNGEVMPLEEKWVVTLSSQYGCSMGCIFCDVPKVGPGRNATAKDLTAQTKAALHLHPEVAATKRLNIHYARMGEPTFNRHVLEHAIMVRREVRPYVGRSLVHPVVSTMLPRRNGGLMEFLQDWCDIKNYHYRGDAGLQFSINSTDNVQRNSMFNGHCLNIEDVAEIGKHLPDPVGRKYALNFALADGFIVDAQKLVDLFNPNKFMVKVTPIHRTQTSHEYGIDTTGGYEYFNPYKQTEADLIAAGFDVLVFIPSYDEDDGLITCGNAILSGSVPRCDYEEM